MESSAQQQQQQQQQQKQKPPGQGLFQCTTCRRTFTRIDHLARHVRSRELCFQHVFEAVLPLLIMMLQICKNARISARSAAKLLVVRTYFSSTR